MAQADQSSPEIRSNLARRAAALRLRMGIILFVLAWIPIAQLLIYLAHQNGLLTDDAKTQAFRLGIWGVQAILGVIGVWLAGQEVIAIIKTSGLKKALPTTWRVFIHGPDRSAH